MKKIILTSSLSNRTHRVITGLAVTDGEKLISTITTTMVHFRRISKREIQSYTLTGEPLDKAGAYGIQGRTAFFIDRIEGDYFNVVGLPLVAPIHDAQEI
jgi:septum formation protein